MSTFIQTLDHAWHTTNSLLCVGLDPEPTRFPGAYANRSDAIFDFCKRIVDATAPYASSFKPQIAYFAAHRAEEQLEQLIAHIHLKHPGLPVILDAKRGDIGSTAEQYAREAFDRYRADAVTVNPYMGFDSIEPYLEHARTCSFWRRKAVRCIRRSRGSRRKSGTRRASWVWWSARRSRRKSKWCAALSATCRC
jgi:orotidine-5'-phosphate decarboxylase